MHLNAARPALGGEPHDKFEAVSIVLRKRKNESKWNARLTNDINIG